MGKVRYLGSKSRLVHEIGEMIGAPTPNQRFVDLFSGTGIVSQTIGQNGWPVLANDFLKAATTITTASLLSSTEVPFKKLGGYQEAIKKLNTLKGKEGFFYREYSSSRKNSLGLSRPYFSQENAKKIDAIRALIKKWSEQKEITKLERTILLADLIGSANQVANIAGTYGCFLKKLSQEASKPIVLKARELNKKSLKWEAHSKDAFDVKLKETDVCYLDPPYTKRQYAAYYHIPETLACEDEPSVDGVTGLRPWESKASLFCYKAKAPIAMKKLLDGINCTRIIISYSSDGHISLDNLMSIARDVGEVKLKTFNDFGRYTPNSTSRKNSEKKRLTEYLISINK
jgi:adenine-specific DNA-methyltransferase